MNPKTMCDKLRRLDIEFKTDKRSPLHHNNRYCPLHGDGHVNTIKRLAEVQS